MQLYKIPDRLAASGLAVFGTRDLARILGMSHGVASVYAHRLKNMELIYPVEKGRFSITEDPFIVATQVSYPSYLSFSSAFYLHGRLDQVIDSLLVVTSRKRRELDFMDTRIKFIRFPPEKVFGYRKHRKGDSHITLADPEKAAIDSLYRPRYASISTVFEALSGGFDTDLFEKYALTDYWGMGAYS
jgi:predicted transcriptional regulator of viral defense system